MTDDLDPPIKPVHPRNRPGKMVAMREKLPSGRPFRLTPEVYKRIIDALKAGVHLSVAAQYAGVAPTTLYKWINVGNNSVSRTKVAVLCRKLTADIALAQASAEVSAVLHWRAAMPKDWHASKDWLVATAPERWASKPDKDRPVSPSTNIAIQLNQSLLGQPIHAQKPLSEMILDHPGLIGPTMQLLDTLLPMLGSGDDYEADNNRVDNRVDDDDISDGTYAVIDPD